MSFRQFQNTEPGKGEGDTEPGKGEGEKLEGFLIKTSTTTIYLQNKTGALSHFYIANGTKAKIAQFRSAAFLENGLKTTALKTVDEVPSEEDYKVFTLKVGMAVTAMLRIIGMYINKIQGIKVQGCNTSK